MVVSAAFLVYYKPMGLLIISLFKSHLKCHPVLGNHVGYINPKITDYPYFCDI